MRGLTKVIGPGRELFSWGAGHVDLIGANDAVTFVLAVLISVAVQSVIVLVNSPDIGDLTLFRSCVLLGAVPGLRYRLFFLSGCILHMMIHLHVVGPPFKLVMNSTTCWALVPRVLARSVYLPTPEFRK